MNNTANISKINAAIQCCMNEYPSDDGLYAFVVEVIGIDGDSFVCNMDNGKQAKVYVGHGSDYDSLLSRVYVSIVYDSNNFICASGAVGSADV